MSRYSQLTSPNSEVIQSVQRLGRLASKTAAATSLFKERLAEALVEIEAEVRTLPQACKTSSSKRGKRKTQCSGTGTQMVDKRQPVVEFPAVRSNARGNRRTKGAYEHHKRKV